jgi:hypothetical protein
MCDVEHAKRRTRKRRQLFRACTLLMVKSNEHVLCGPGFCAVVMYVHARARAAGDSTNGAIRAKLRPQLISPLLSMQSLVHLKTQPDRTNAESKPFYELV